jgi:hypothetical protein
LLFLPQTQQARLRFLQRVALLLAGRGFLLRQELLEAIPKGLRGEALRLQAPEGIKDALPIPVARLGLGAGRTNAVDGGEQQVVSGRRTGAGFPPQGLQQGEDPGLLGSQPEGSGQAQLAPGNGEGQGSGAIFEQGGDLFSVAQIRSGG